MRTPALISTIMLAAFFTLPALSFSNTVISPSTGKMARMEDIQPGKPVDNFTGIAGVDDTLAMSLTNLLDQPVGQTVFGAYEPLTVRMATNRFALNCHGSEANWLLAHGALAIPVNTTNISITSRNDSQVLIISLWGATYRVNASTMPEKETQNNAAHNPIWMVFVPPNADSPASWQVFGYGTDTDPFCSALSNYTAFKAKQVARSGNLVHAFLSTPVEIEEYQTLLSSY